jgi:hypothetical protein
MAQKLKRSQKLIGSQTSGPKLRGSQKTTPTLGNALYRRDNKPITLNNSTTTFSQQPSNFNPPSEAKSPMIGQSFEKMGLGQIGGLGGRMGQLEQASMRLAQAASDRRMGEAEQETKLKGQLLGQEYELRRGLAQSQANIESAQAAQMAGYSSPFQMQTDIASQRQEREAREKEQERIARAASRGYSASGNLLPQYYPTR